eukprot:TRINITY_DN20301_c0_g1_i1.p1 TRINITY_DN20301_c0_g1~~TRINITY_DN20301_c0_g1_i1.p1  ORF type:complete len:146 (+),score=43.16 TRINITY_DN20301_c0_g1_i1:42-440(+)
MDCGYCAPQMMPRGATAAVQCMPPPCGDPCDDECECDCECDDCDYDECGFERRNALEGNAQRIAFLRMQLGLPVQPTIAERAYSQLSTASPENAQKIKELRDKLGVPYLKSMEEERKERERQAASPYDEDRS